MPRTLTPSTESRSATQTVLVLQGGGALGAYQGGVFEALSAHAVMPDWVVGTSIGAINGAIIAGNPPERRLERLREFWHLVGRDDPMAGFSAHPLAAWLAPWFNAGELWNTIAHGIPGFFAPRRGGLPNINQMVPTRDASFYDTAPLRATLERLVDFDYLNARHVRCTVCAVALAASGSTRTPKPHAIAAILGQALGTLFTDSARESATPTSGAPTRRR